MTPATIEAERNEALLAWYGTNRRSLPWRDSKDPYTVLVSEVMLQQTQAERVVPYYQRFVDSFPTVAHLAAAPFRDVAAMWSGLGYNQRAKRLQEASRLVAADGWPRTVEGLEALPGVGPYTARAIASMAFGEHVAAVDTNLRRVLARWHGENLSGRRLDHTAAVALADADAADWNQALMDLGAQLCLPRSPQCDICPVTAWCAGPETYQAPRAQPRFEGSMRQIHGAVVRHLVLGPATFTDIVATSGAEPIIVAEAIDALIEDGMLEPTDAGYQLAD